MKPAQPSEINRHDQRPVGVGIPIELLRIDDIVNVAVEAQMMHQPTGVILHFKHVVYKGVTAGRRQFDSAVESHFFSDHEIARVALADDVPR